MKYFHSGSIRGGFHARKESIKAPLCHKDILLHKRAGVSNILHIVNLENDTDIPNILNGAATPLSTDLASLGLRDRMPANNQPRRGSISPKVAA